MNQERSNLKAVEGEVSEWFAQPRWRFTKRDYTPADVAPLRGSLKIEYPSNYTAKKLYDLVRQKQENSSYTATYGALDPVQVVNEAKYLDTIYVSGWQCSSTANPTFQRGPDFADYPLHTVPSKVKQLFESLLYEDRIQTQARAAMSPEELKATPKRDFLVPLIADADCGFGGVTSTMKLAKLFAESGAAGIHIEDQKAGAKKCGHMGGKVIVSCQEWLDRLKAARLQFDIMGTETVIVARSDTFSGKYIDTTHDIRDQAFVLGNVEPEGERLMTYVEAGLEAIKKTLALSKQSAAINEWNSLAPSLGLKEARKLATKLGFEFYFDWDSCRTSEGFFLLNSGLACAINRVKHAYQYCDMFWMETPKPDIDTCRSLATAVRQIHPKIMLAYNLSPSFNWELFDEKYLRSFCDEIGKLGFCWQFITLAGFHMDSLISEVFSREFKKDKMYAFVKYLQSQEREQNVDQLKHQKWSGASLVDREVGIVTSGAASTQAMQDGCTEDQFQENKIKARL